LTGDAYRLALVILRSREEAEDAVQEATLKAWLAFVRLRDHGAARAWFLTIVANQCRAVRRGRWFGVLRGGDLPEGSDDPWPAAERSADLQRALSHLRPEDRTALFLH